MSKALSSKIDGAATLAQFTLLLADVVVDDKELAIVEDLLVHSLDGSLGMSGLLKAHIAVILGLSVGSFLDLSRFNSSKFTEKCLKLSIISTFGKVLDKEVVSLGLSGGNGVLRLLFVFLVVPGDLKLLSFELKIVDGIESGISGTFLSELNVGKASALLAVGIGLELSGDNFSERLKQVKDLLLSSILVNILNKEISILVILWLCSGVNDADSEATESGVIHLIQAALSLFFLHKLEVAIAARFVSLRVNDDLGVLDLVSLAGEELVEVEIEEVLLREVAHVKTGKLVHSLLALLLVLVIAALGIRSVAEVQVRQLVH